uniref:Helicase ATP-binding domain-containing protein n=1 Tax=Steinernema glaseri TaxID=37863 RepID=A0A1I7Y3L6_9BILA
MTIPQFETMPEVAGEDRIEKWSKMYAKKPTWKKLDEDTLHTPNESGDMQPQPQERRFPAPPPRGTNPKYDRIQAQREKLIITEYKKLIIDQVMSKPVTILCGDTGCGKSTQVAQYL